jgi:hypothetical protein
MALDDSLGLRKRTQASYADDEVTRDGMTNHHCSFGQSSVD